MATRWLSRTDVDCVIPLRHAFHYLGRSPLGTNELAISDMSYYIATWVLPYATDLEHDQERISSWLWLILSHYWHESVSSAHE